MDSLFISRHTGRPFGQRIILLVVKQETCRDNEKTRDDETIQKDVIQRRLDIHGVLFIE